MRRLAALILALLAFAAPPARAARDTLTIGLSQFPSGLHPYFDPEVVKGYILAMAIRPVTAFDADWKNSCMLCTELPTLENGRVKLETRANGQPGMAIRLTLRDDIFWDDGTPLTTADLAFTAKIGADPASGFPDLRAWGRVERVEVIDAHNAVLHLDEVWGLYDRIGTLLPAHIEGPVREKAGDAAGYLKGTAYNRAQTTRGLFNGPYRIADYQSGSQVVLERNPAWKGPAPAFNRVVFRGILNTAALQANLLSGDVDFAPEFAGLTIDQVIELQKQFPDRFDYRYRSTLSYTHIDVQLENPVLADIRVRRALLAAIDRDAIVQRLYGGRADVATAWVPPGDPMFNPSLPKVAYDPARAKALLAEAGWTPGADGICRNKDGQRLSIVFSTSSGIRLGELTQQVIQSQWKAVCIDTVIKNEPFRTLFGQTMKQRKFEGVSLYSWVLGLSFPPRQLYHSASIPTTENNWSGSNFMAWRNKVIDEGIGAAENELDPAKAKATWGRMQQAYAEELPALPLFFPQVGVALPKWLKGYQPTGITAYPPLWVESWRVQE